ncbi:MAG TPA: hypothetical protein VGR01_19735 [Burkholderiales bacterium]|jgi:hypothetical protein|nr:hypothetical protein [Burkholderiales bacterium]
MSAKPAFDATELQAAIGTGRPAVSYDRAGRIRLITAAANQLIASKTIAGTFVGQALMAWLSSEDNTDLARDHLQVTLPKSHVTVQRLYRILIEDERQPENAALPCPPTPSKAKGER